jgi:hypothetical protein
MDDRAGAARPEHCRWRATRPVRPARSRDVRVAHRVRQRRDTGGRARDRPASRARRSYGVRRRARPPHPAVGGGGTVARGVGRRGRSPRGLLVQPAVARARAT